MFLFPAVGGNCHAGMANDRIGREPELSGFGAVTPGAGVEVEASVVILFGASLVSCFSVAVISLNSLETALSFGKFE